ncbi:MAG: GNAT family protein [Pseudomonadota bacterium]
MSLGLATCALIVGDYRLAPLQRDDAAGLLELFGDPLVAEYMDIAPLTTLAQAQDIVDWGTELAAVDGGVRWTIRRAGDPALIGTVGFNNLVFDRARRGEVAYDLRRADWGRGVMSQILPHVLAFGFHDLSLRRIEAMVTLGNARSCALLERHGFSLEGTLRDHAHWKGRYWDQLIYGRLAD